MVSGILLNLVRLVLLRSDQHPIRIIDGNDLLGVDSLTVRRLEGLGVLVEREPPHEADGFILGKVGDDWIATNCDGDGISAKISEDCVQHFRIDLLAVCRQIRFHSAFQGRAVEAITHSTYWIGAQGKGGRRTEFYLARNLRSETALDVTFALKARSGGLPIVVFTPTERNLPGHLLRQLNAEHITVTAVDGLLDPTSKDPFRLIIPQVSTHSDSSSNARLVVDAQGSCVRFDGTDVPLKRRELVALVLLANELSMENGFVSRDALAEAIAPAPGGREVNDEQVDKVISNLRKALRSAYQAAGHEGPDPIELRRRIGYRLTLARGEVRVF